MRSSFPGRWTADELRREVATRTWFHTIDLGDGIRTPGQKDTLSEVTAMHIPPSLAGTSVLDVGAYDGFYSFEAEARGASYVLATDKWTWQWEGSDARRNFELVREVRGSAVDDLEIAVEDLSPETLGRTFDLVLFLGVLYHAPDPLGYLRRVRSVTSGMAIVETVVDLLDVPVPALAYYPGASLNGDASNHFGPNPKAVEGLLLDAGFSRVESFAPWQSERMWAVQAPTAGRPNLGLATRARRKLRRSPRSGRMVFHAYA
jgi:tRNA (mo5U34)-methyltransferase